MQSFPEPKPLITITVLMDSENAKQLQIAAQKKSVFI